MEAASSSAPSATRDDISIAFKHSDYATPYGDNEIPGNRPGHRLRTLGRSYAPQPLTASHMNNALIVPYNGNGDNAGGHTARDNYILNVRNGGRRHFSDERATERPWRPVKGYVPSPCGGAAGRRPQGKGRGVFNFESSGHPDAVAALAAREQVTSVEHKGKARVPRPPDHTLVQLGLWNVATGPARASLPPVRAEGSGVAASTLSPGPQSGAAAEAPATRSAAPPSQGPSASPLPPPTGSSCGAVNGFAFSCGYVNEATGIAAGPYVGAGRPPLPVPEHLQERQARLELRSTRRTQVHAVRDAEDIAAVRRLPEW